MSNSVLLDYQGPDWPLGFVAVGTPGTPVNIMHNVDPGNNNAPGAPTNPSGNRTEYTPVVYSVWFQGVKPNGNNSGMQYNSGNVYIMRSPSSGAAGNLTDFGAMVQVLSPGQTVALPISPASMRAYSPYRYFLDADIAGDGALVTAIGG